MLVKFSWQTTDRQLRQFGGTALVALPLLAFLLAGWRPSLWTSAQQNLAGILFAVAGVSGCLALLYPRALRYPFLFASLATLPIGLVVGEVLLAVIYFGLFTPIALWFRLIGRDALKLRMEPAASSYWTPKSRANNLEAYFHQS